MDISIIVCTHNRAKTLKETLLSFSQLKWHKGTSYELLVVDNNSGDNTKAVVAKFARENPNIRYVVEDKVGLSHARNRGILETQGNIAAFVDDDIAFDECWGQAILQAFKDYELASCVGGKNIPVFLEGSPEWKIDDVAGFYGDTRFGETPKFIEFPEYPFGLNMACKREVFSKVGLFSIDLGRYGGSLLSGEEAEFFYRVNMAGLKVFYTPHAVIHHRIPAERTKARWILRRFFYQGVSDVIFEQMKGRQSRQELFRSALKNFSYAKRYIVGDFLYSPRKLRWHLKKIKPEGWADILYKIGRMRQELADAVLPNRKSIKI